MSAKPKVKPEQGLTVEKAKELFEVVFCGENLDFSLVYQYYDTNVSFQDSIQSVEGRNEFIEMIKRFIERCKELSLDVHHAVQGESVIFLHWTLKFKLFPLQESTFEGVSKLTLNEAGKVIRHRDFFDMWGDTFGSIPLLGGLYRRFMKLMG